MNKHIDAIIVMTNSVIKSNGKATFEPEVTNSIKDVEYEIMDEDGSNKRPMKMTLGARLGFLMKDSRHKTRLLGKFKGKHIVGMPHKFDWRDKEDVTLIEREAENLVRGINNLKWKYICMIRPIKDKKVWETFKPKLEAIFGKTECKIGVFSGEEYLPPPPKPKPFKECTDEEKKARRKAAAAKAKATKESKRIKAEDTQANLEKEQEERRVSIEAEIGEYYRELD
jgi:hypothetical protein